MNNKPNFNIDQNFFINSDNKKSIIIYNSISGVGHFDSWCALFAKCLALKGWTICVATVNKHTIDTELESFNAEFKKNILIIDSNTQLPISHIYKKLSNNSFLIYLRKILKYEIEKNHGNIQSLTSRIKQALRRRMLSLLKRVSSPSLKISAHSPIIFAQDLKLINQTFRGKPNLTLNMYLDLYSNSKADWSLFNNIIENPWATIHIDTTNTLQQIDKSYIRNLKTILYINEDLKLNCTYLKEAPTVYWIPDVATTNLPVEESQISLLIKERAKNRKIVFLGGAIGGTKNLSTWYEVIFKSNPNKWFFVQAGVVNRSTLSASDLINCKRIDKSSPENLLICDQYIKNDSEFNQLISVSDIIWGLYRNFDRSSNILGKAAAFHKPILVSDKYLMGQRVLQYEIGIALDESDSDKVIESMETLLQNPIPIENFSRYQKEHDENALSEKIDKYLTELI